jgi:hypothetical protein
MVRNAYWVTVKPMSTMMSTRPAVRPNTTTSPDSRPVKVMPAPNSQTSSSIQVGTSESARSCPRIARNRVRAPPTDAIMMLERRAKVAANRGSRKAMATRTSCAVTQSINSMRTKPCHAPSRRKV